MAIIERITTLDKGIIYEQMRTERKGKKQNTTCITLFKCRDTHHFCISVYISQKKQEDHKDKQQKRAHKLFCKILFDRKLSVWML